MESRVFRKLREAIEWPCRSKDWFGMAEQAITTVYALGEHPDVLCNDIVTSLARRAFCKDTSTSNIRQNEDVMDAGAYVRTSGLETTTASGWTETLTVQGDVFQLSQLLFVVGLVAIKQIAFLEVVEREWKRQKDEKQKGTRTKTIPEN